MRKENLSSRQIVVYRAPGEDFTMLPALLEDCINKNL